MATQSTPVNFSSEVTRRMLAAHCKANGRNLGDLLEEGHSVPGMVNDQIQGAVSRLRTRNELPEAILAEAEANADRLAPIPAGK
jgi:hypothetical protein